ncbi:hypothetical protein FOC1_g10000683 [Fusarium oxysporum f. sp. cubense race 1]|uniref:Rhodopsin domain-containing protein n=1 Tax=Fusarium oxysporum f. sp. cubense (strain race 1) TaxID=1229664 RepID=N4TZ61_FUSC1|nr:hypothetical protein FOC1_g10000683 [Fusarium oxysporum f. sp. cubense race 1]
MIPLVIESWIWYAVTWLVVIVRLLSRRMVVGSVKKYQIEDYLMILAMVCDAVLIACINASFRMGNNLIDPTQRITLTPDEISRRRFGSKLTLIAEMLQCTVIWLVKCCLLLIYNRLTTNLSYNRVVKTVALYVLVGFVVMMTLYLAVWCRPFSQYWAVPTEHEQCATSRNHLVTNATFNLSSDIMIILLPIPLFLWSNTTTRIKVTLCCIYAVGIFTIVSAFLNKYCSFTDPYGPNWTFWYIRESSTSLIVANLPLTWPFFRRVMHINTSSAGDSNPQLGHRDSHLFGNVPPRPSLILADSRIELSQEHGFP